MTETPFTDIHVIGTTQQSHYLWYTCYDPDAYPSTRGWQPNYGDVDSEIDTDTLGPYQDIACACWPDGQTFVAIELNTKGELYYVLRQSGSWRRSGRLDVTLNLPEKTAIIAVACTVNPSDNILYVCGITDPAQGSSPYPYIWYAWTADFCTTWTQATVVDTGSLAQLHPFYGLTCAVSPLDEQLHCITLNRNGYLYHLATPTIPTANSWQCEQVPQVSSPNQVKAASLAAGPLWRIDRFASSSDLVVFVVTQFAGGLYYTSHQQDGSWTSFTKITFPFDSPFRHLSYNEVSCALAASIQDSDDYLLSLFALDSAGIPYFMAFQPRENLYSWYALNSYEHNNQKQFTALAAASWPGSRLSTDAEDSAVDDQEMDESAMYYQEFDDSEPA